MFKMIPENRRKQEERKRKEPKKAEPGWAPESMPVETQKKTEDKPEIKEKPRTNIRVPEFLSNILNNTKNLLKNTSIEIAILGVAGALAGGAMMYSHEVKRATSIPLTFSEIASIEKKVNEMNQFIGPTTKYLASTSDACMKIFEAYNESHKNFTFKPELFRENISLILDEKNKRFRYNLADLIRIVPEEISKIYKNHPQINSVDELSSKSASFLVNTWSDRHIDHYKTVYYPEEETYYDSDGKSHTRTVIKSKSVHDYTDHYYDFNPQAGYTAKDLLEKMLATGEKLSLHESIIRATKTHEEGRKAIKKSREKLGEDTSRFSEQTYLDLANTWADGSHVTLYAPRAHSAWNETKAQNSQFANSLATSRSRHQRTWTRSDDGGPIEFKISRSIQYSTQRLAENMRELNIRLNGTISEIKSLDKNVRAYIAPNSNVAPDPIINQARKIYKTNFPKGIDINPFRVSMIFLGIFGGAFLGCGTGVLLDQADKRFQIYGPRDESGMGRFNRMNSYRRDYY